MHKKEASELFSLLGDENRVKIVKILFNKKKEFTLLDITNFLELEENITQKHLDILTNSNLLIKKGQGYICNYDLVSELMSFVITPCKCCK